MDDNEYLRQRATIWRIKRVIFWFWYIPYDWLVDRHIASLCDPWGKCHYYGYSNDDLVERVLFLQSAGRLAHSEAEVLRRVILPVSVFLAVVVGLLIGRFT